jgi:hypothetical protein
MREVREGSGRTVRKSSMAIGNKSIAEVIPACGRGGGLVKLIEVLSKIRMDYAGTLPGFTMDWHQPLSARENFSLEHLMPRGGHPSFHMASRSVAAVTPSTLASSHGEQGMRCICSCLPVTRGFNAVSLSFPGRRYEWLHRLMYS